MLVLLYYLSQNADFAESVKPLMSKIKDSEEMLRFLNDLSKFTQTFSTLNTDPPKKEEKKEQPKEKSKEKCDPKKESDENKKDPQSPTSGIADEFIQSILDSYLKKT